MNPSRATYAQVAQGGTHDQGELLPGLHATPLEKEPPKPAQLHTPTNELAESKISDTKHPYTLYKASLETLRSLVNTAHDTTGIAFLRQQLPPETEVVLVRDPIIKEVVYKVRVELTEYEAQTYQQLLRKYKVAQYVDKMVAPETEGLWETDMRPDVNIFELLEKEVGMLPKET